MTIAETVEVVTAFIAPQSTGTTVPSQLPGVDDLWETLWDDGEFPVRSCAQPRNSVDNPVGPKNPLDLHLCGWDRDPH